MSNSTSFKNQLFLGIDGGGSKCRAVIYTEQDGILADAIAGPANVLRGAEKAQQHIIEATDAALAKLGLDPSYKSQLIAGIGLAGLNLSSCLQTMQQWQSPFKQSYYTTDLHIASLAAHDGADGAVMIIGTGSSALLVKGPDFVEKGGHGFGVGDIGSGAWLGLKAIEITLLALDDIETSSSFTDAIASHYQVTKAIDLALAVSSFSPRDFAKLAPLVMQFANANDPFALAIVEEGAKYLSKLASVVLNDSDLKLALIGGLAPLMVPYLTTDIQQCLSEAKHNPEYGAILFAQQQASTLTKLN